MLVRENAVLHLSEELEGSYSYGTTSQVQAANTLLRSDFCRHGQDLKDWPWLLDSWWPNGMYHTTLGHVNR